MKMTKKAEQKRNLKYLRERCGIYPPTAAIKHLHRQAKALQDLVWTIAKERDKEYNRKTKLMAYVERKGIRVWAAIEKAEEKHRLEIERAANR